MLRKENRKMAVSNLGFLRCCDVQQAMRRLFVLGCSMAAGLAFNVLWGPQWVQHYRQLDGDLVGRFYGIDRVFTLRLWEY